MKSSYNVIFNHLICHNFDGRKNARNKDVLGPGHHVSGDNGGREPLHWVSHAQTDTVVKVWSEKVQNCGNASRSNRHTHRQNLLFIYIDLEIFIRYKIHGQGATESNKRRPEGRQTSRSREYHGLISSIK